jgi:hypothetical protein
MSARPALPVRPLLLAVLVLLLLAASAVLARAQSVVQVPPPTPPPEADSLAAWVSDARAGFQSNQGDSASGENYHAYEDVGLIARRLIHDQGPMTALSALAVRARLDSLGFTTEVAVDLSLPGFALLMVRNPRRLAAEAVAFLYWRRGDDLRLQGVLFRGGHHPRVRVWVTGKPEYPYEWGILSETRDEKLEFTLLRLSPAGTQWGIEQDEESSALLGEPGEAQFVDVNRDGNPEIATWTHGVTDSLFTECSDCPRLTTERLYVESPVGFELEDERLLPTPYATLVYFVRLLIDGRLAQAERLVRDPAKLKDALARGWNRRVAKQPWRIEYGEQGQSWPRRLEVRFQGPQGVKRYGFVFAKHEGHWIIDEWFEPGAPGARLPASPPGPARGARTPPARGAAKPAAPPVKR